MSSLILKKSSLMYSELKSITFFTLFMNLYRIWPLAYTLSIVEAEILTSGNCLWNILALYLSERWAHFLKVCWFRRKLKCSYVSFYLTLGTIGDPELQARSPTLTKWLRCYQEMAVSFEIEAKLRTGEHNLFSKRSPNLSLRTKSIKFWSWHLGIFDIGALYMLDRSY